MASLICYFHLIGISFSFIGRLAGSQDHVRLELIRQSDPDTFQALEWFRKHRSKFSGRVAEPICLELSVKDQRYAAIVETALSKQAMMSFVFEDGADYEFFLTTCSDSMGLRVNAIHIIKSRPEEYLPFLLREDIVERLHFDCYLRDIISAPDIVIAALCDQFKIHLQVHGPITYDSRWLWERSITPPWTDIAKLPNTMLQDRHLRYDTLGLGQPVE